MVNEHEIGTLFKISIYETNKFHISTCDIKRILV